jgi:hypothetical protein
MGQIVTAIESYESTYSQMPCSKAAAASAAAAIPGGDDFTYGGVFGPNVVEASGPYKTNNAELMAILMDLEAYGDGRPTINRDHVKNTQKVALLNAKMVDDVKLPGVGPDGVYRDPWGNPYIISIDLNSNEKCMDQFYRKKVVSQDPSQPAGQAGFNGLFNAKDPAGASDDFEHNGKVMVWSAGPDKLIDPATKAKLGANKDNVLSWK